MPAPRATDAAMRRGAYYAPILMGVADAALYIGVSQTTLRSLPIPKKRLGARVLYHRFDLEAYAAELNIANEKIEVTQTADDYLWFKIGGAPFTARTVRNQTRLKKNSIRRD